MSEADERTGTAVPATGEETANGGPLLDLSTLPDLSVSLASPLTSGDA